MCVFHGLPPLFGSGNREGRDAPFLEENIGEPSLDGQEETEQAELFAMCLIVLRETEV